MAHVRRVRKKRLPPPGPELGVHYVRYARNGQLSGSDISDLITEAKAWPNDKLELIFLAGIIEACPLTREARAVLADFLRTSVKIKMQRGSHRPVPRFVRRRQLESPIASAVAEVREEMKRLHTEGEAYGARDRVIEVKARKYKVPVEAIEMRLKRSPKQMRTR
jgi:hypothetical protein